MGKRKKKKKDILKRLAQKRGERSRRKKKLPRPKAAAAPTAETEQKLKEALEGSADLAYHEQFSDLHFPADALTSYLEEVRKREETETGEFLRQGVSRLSTPAFLSQVKERLARIEGLAGQNDPERASASVVRKALESGISPSSIPLIALLFLRDVKNHPVSDDAKIWKLVYPFLPSRIVTPEKREEEKETEYPHIIIPHSHK